ncbi:tyrosine-type recombinase/integrase [Piscirickettsia salmonis]|uniref:tyrosine-type recombinase/integrase n=1 Tax=Piscirickettsia salmonis TaxID=1238 RepID=UPI0007D791E4|nr:site-specific tyrosine recombinase XerC [Piscirickettsiaceae bacterium NZ-RLO1]
MSLSKQAKILSERQEKAVLSSLQSTTYPTRNTVMFLLSIKAGLRAKEIAALTWDMLLTPEGELCEAIHLRNTASKGKQGGRVIPLNKQLKQALSQLLDEPKPKHGQRPVTLSRRNSHFPAQTVVNWFAELYKNLGFEGCSSHSGRRTFVTRAAKISSELVVLCVTFNNWLGIPHYKQHNVTSRVIVRLKRGL